MQAANRFPVADILCVMSLATAGVQVPLESLLTPLRKQRIAALLSHIHSQPLVMEFDTLHAHIQVAAQSLQKQFPELVLQRIEMNGLTRSERNPAHMEELLAAKEARFRAMRKVQPVGLEFLGRSGSRHR